MFNFSPQAVFIGQALVVATKLFVPLFLGMGLAFCLGLFRIPGVRIWLPVVGAVVGARLGYAFYSTANPDRMWPYSSPAGGGAAGLITGLLISTIAALLKRGFQPEMPLPSELSAVELVKPTQPRIGIVHLMLWMAGSALLLSISQLFRQEPRQGTTSLLSMSFFVTNAMIGGVAIASLFLWVSRRVRGGVPFPSEPGHYLLLLQGGAILLFQFGNPLLSVVVKGLVSMGIWVRAPLFFYLTQSLLAGCLAMLVLRCLAAGIRPFRWKVVFVVYFLGISFIVLAYLGSLSLLFRRPYPLNPLLLWVPLHVAMGLSLTTAIIMDARSGVRRDWLHYAGVITWLAAVAVSWLFQLAVWLMNTQRSF